jgi:hypothetical protein
MKGLQASVKLEERSNGEQEKQHSYIVETDGVYYQPPLENPLKEHQAY